MNRSASQMFSKKEWLKLLQIGLTVLAVEAGSANVVLAQSPFINGNTSSSMVQGGTNSSLVHGGVDTQSQDVNILFLIDASYSMKEKFGGTDRKMSAAKQVIEHAMAMIPASINVGCRVFGQSFSGAPEIDCRQTCVLVPLGRHNRGSLIAAVRTIQPAGLTPLEFALRRCAEEDFSRCQGTKTIILISDGLDTCGGDPCAYMTQLGRYGINIRCDVVGLELKKDHKAQEQLNCLAQSSGGKYYDASNSDDLIQSVAHSVKRAISGKVIIKPKDAPEQQGGDHSGGPANSGSSGSSGVGSAGNGSSSSSAMPELPASAPPASLLTPAPSSKVSH